VETFPNACSGDMLIKSKHGVGDDNFRGDAYFRVALFATTLMAKPARSYMPNSSTMTTKISHIRNAVQRPGSSQGSVLA